MRVLRLPCKGSWLGAAETEGFRLFLEKPPLEAEKQPRYAENPVILLWRGLAAGQAGTPQSAALTAPLAGEPERVFSDCSRPLCPSSVSLTRASTTFYGIAATGSYVRFNSLRDAPPAGEAFSPTFPTGEGGSPQARRMRGVAGVSCRKYARSKAPLSGALARRSRD